jgi:hypothetical protein
MCVCAAACAVCLSSWQHVVAAHRVLPSCRRELRLLHHTRLAQLLSAVDGAAAAQHLKQLVLADCSLLQAVTPPAAVYRRIPCLWAA